MQTYIAILRGINVSGQKVIKMAELREHLASLDFSKLTTYIQSGNIVFQSAVEKNSVLEEKIHQNIKGNYGFEVPVIVRTQKEWQAVIDRFPFNLEECDINRLGITFLKNKPAKIPLEEINKFKAANDELVFENKELYFHIPDGFGTSKLTLNVLERKLKVSATMRNWKTTIKLLELCKNLE
ncbi:MAG: DUF1697 domain-containing protein [Cyclobacteriaceae bacterium]|nr:DUF1697 domain-containing protein [Cyclobacteriaceae bacterium]